MATKTITFTETQALTISEALEAYRDGLTSDKKMAESQDERDMAQAEIDDVEALLNLIQTTFNT